MDNLGLQYYKTYYAPFETREQRKVFDPRKFSDDHFQDQIKDRNKDFFAAKNKAFYDYSFNVADSEILRTSWDNELFRYCNFLTTYPGLIAGTGYTHETGTKDEFKLGFFFDHTTGLPVIPGSSVKGVLRSIFPQCPVKRDDELKIDFRSEEKIQDARNRAGFLLFFLNKITPVIFPQTYEPENIPGELLEILHRIELEIFEGIDWKKTIEERKKNPKTKCYFSIYKRDIFMDASIKAKNTDKSGSHIFGKDFITPHKHKTDSALDPFANPTPLQFLKILPNVEFQFPFMLHNCSIEPGLKNENKRNLFTEIILTLGVGAKTNVGYGQFKPALMRSPDPIVFKTRPNTNKWNLTS